MSYPGTTDFPTAVGIADGANLDAFSRLRVSYPNAGNVIASMTYKEIR